jgi:hypothetical protein
LKAEEREAASEIKIVGVLKEIFPKDRGKPIPVLRGSIREDLPLGNNP